MIATACISAAIGIVFGFLCGCVYCTHLLERAKVGLAESRDMLNRAEAAVLRLERMRKAGKVEAVEIRGQVQ